MAEVGAAMVRAYIDWYLVQPQLVRDHCLDVAELKAMMRELKDGKKERDGGQGDDANALR